MGRKIALWLCQVPVLGSWSEYRRSLYSLVLRTCLSVEMWSMPLRKGQLLEASSGGREAFGWMGIFGYSSCWLISAVDREGSPQRQVFPGIASDGSRGAAAVCAYWGSSLVNLLLYCVIFITVILGSMGAL